MAFGFGRYRMRPREQELGSRTNVPFHVEHEKEKRWEDPIMKSHLLAK